MRPERFARQVPHMHEPEGGVCTVCGATCAEDTGGAERFIDALLAGLVTLAAIVTVGTALVLLAH